MVADFGHFSPYRHVASENTPNGTLSCGVLSRCRSANNTITTQSMDIIQATGQHRDNAPRTTRRLARLASDKMTRQKDDSDSVRLQDVIRSCIVASDAQKRLKPATIRECYKWYRIFVPIETMKEFLL